MCLPFTNLVLIILAALSLSLSPPTRKHPCVALLGPIHSIYCFSFSLTLFSFILVCTGLFKTALEYFSPTLAHMHTNLITELILLLFTNTQRPSAHTLPKWVMSRVSLVPLGLLIVPLGPLVKFYCFLFPLSHAIVKLPLFLWFQCCNRLLKHKSVVPC